jgi:2-deoxy-D-gluconate 3-dehydrogenase
MTLDAPFDLAGKNALITGAGRGIGRGIAEVLARAGANVALNAKTQDYVLSAASEIARTSGRTVVPIVADLTSWECASTTADEAVAALGRIDILVNCVGDARRTPMESATNDEIRDALDVNLVATIMCCRVVGPRIAAGDGGKIVNISSTSATRGGADRSIYTAAKAGVVALTRALALEWAPCNVQVNAILPGIFPDPIGHDAETMVHLEERTREGPAGRPGRMNEIGYLTLFLVSGASDYITGQAIVIDGGMSL